MLSSLALFSWQAKAWRPRLSLLSRRAREGHHVAIPILRFGQSCTRFTRLPLPIKDTGWGCPKPGLASVDVAMPDSTG